MEQIKQSQILHEETKSPNPIVGFPRDLTYLASTSNKVLDVQTPNSTVDNGNSILPPVEQDPVPHTPAIIEIKEQIVIFNADGSAKIDVILGVEDVEAAVEYDVRVTKNAGNV